MLAWLVLPLHNDSMRPLPEGAAIAAALKNAGLAEGAYVYPAPAEHEEDASVEQASAACEEFVALHEAGPVYSVYYQPGGMSPMGPGVMGRGFVIDVVACLLAALVVAPMARAGAGFFLRWRTVVGMGLFASVYCYGALWNWMAFPLGFVADMMLDIVLCWTLAGAVIAAIVKPVPAAKA